MATSKAVRADDLSGLNIATASFTEDAVTKDVQRVILNNSTDGTMATVGSAGLKVDPSGATSPVSIAATVNVRPSDGTNPVTKTFDLDSGAGTEYNLGVGLRKAASGGSVEAGTSSDPLRIDPTGTTVQPVSASSLPLPTGAATSAKQPAIGTAGTASADVLTVQGKAGMTAVVVDGSGVTQPVSGTFFQSTQPVSIAATVVVKADTAGNQANALKVDGSAVTQPVSGTVTANAGTGTFGTSDAATSATASAVPAKAIYVGANKSGNLVGLTLDGSSNLNVNLAAGTISGGNAAASATGSAVPASADYTGFNSGGNLVGVSSAAPLPVTLANTGANSTAVKVDGSAVTQPVSAASLPLPSGASTAAKQPALGTAGTASSDVITIQGIASMTKLLVTPDSVALPANQSVNNNQIVGTAIDVNSGNKSAGTQRVVLATDQPALTNALKVDGSAVTQPVSGTVTANQGTSPWVNQESATQVVTIARSSSNPASSGDNTIVAAQGVGKVIYVFAYSLSFSGTVNAKFTDGAAGTQKAFHYGVANSGGGEAVKPPSYLWSGTANTALILNLSGATAVACNISYFVI